MRAGVGTRSKFSPCSRNDRSRQDFFGRAEETEAHINEALRLSPRDTNAYLWLQIAGVAKFLVGSDEEAVARLRRSIETNRNYPMAHFYLAAALAHLGRTD